MYLVIDVGGTKTLVATFDDHGQLGQQSKFATPPDYDDFLVELGKSVVALGEKDFRAACIALPGRIDRKSGVGVFFGNLPWENVPIQVDLEKLVNCPVVVENDAKLAGLSEALKVIKEFRRVLYVTIGTGIGSAIIIDGVIDPDFADSEGGRMLLAHNGKREMWEHFASGKAIAKRLNKHVSDINDASSLMVIAQDIAAGLIDLIAIVQPEVIIIGGGVGAHLDKFKQQLVDDLKEFETPLMPIPPIRKAVNPEEAVLYGCYEMIKQRYGKTS